MEKTTQATPPTSGKVIVLARFTPAELEECKAITGADNSAGAVAGFVRLMLAARRAAQ